MKTFLIVLVLVGGLISLIAMLTLVPSNPSPVDVAQDKLKDDCFEHSFGYLVGLQRGDSSVVGYWKPGVTPKKLFNVRDFDEITHGFMNKANGKPYKNPRIYYQYEVQSSTQGGFAIRKRWNVIMERNSQDYGGKGCAIVQLAEAE